MPTALHMVNNLGALRPHLDQDAEVWGHMKIAQQEVVKVQISRPQNYKFRCKFFVMLKIVLDNQEQYKSVEDLLDIFKLAIGHARVIETPDGIVRLPKSISYPKMTAPEFDAFYNKAVDWMLSTVIPGLQRQHLDAEVEAELIGFAG